MRKWVVGILLSAFLPMFIMLVMLIGMFGGSGGGAATVSPLFMLVDEQEAERYQEICVPLGVPWDLVILTDCMNVFNQNKKDLKEYSPLLTALEFCAIEETEFEIKEVEEGSGEALLYEPVTEEQPGDGGEPIETGLELLAYREPEIFEQGEAVQPEETETPGEPEPSPGPEESAAPEETVSPEPEMIRVWVPKEAYLYTGKAEILGYMGIAEKASVCGELDGFRDKIKQTAEEKGGEGRRFEADLLTMEASAYREILLKSLKEEDADYVLEVWETEYLQKLYGDGSRYLPPEPSDTPESVHTPESTAVPAD